MASKVKKRFSPFWIDDESYKSLNDTMKQFIFQNRLYETILFLDHKSVFYFQFLKIENKILCLLYYLIIN